MTLASPPFTAEQIREATPHGYAVDLVTERSGLVVDRRRTVYLTPDQESVSIAVTALTDLDEPSGAPMVARSTWEDLRDHAVFPPDSTIVTEETIETALGRLQCTRFDVARGDLTLVFWFCELYPGMPIRYATLSDGEEVESATVVAVSRGAEAPAEDVL